MIFCSSEIQKMDNSAIKALFDRHDIDDAHRIWLGIVISSGFSDDMVMSQLSFIRELTLDDPFYFLIEETLGPYKKVYPRVFNQAQRWRWRIEYDADSSDEEDTD